MIKLKGKKGKISLFLIFVLLFSLLASSLVMAETLNTNKKMAAVESQEEAILEEFEEEAKVESKEELGQETEIESQDESEVDSEKQEETVKEEIKEEPKEDPQVEPEEQKEARVEAGEEEIDQGPMLDNMPATPHPSNPTPIIRFAAGSLGSALTMGNSLGLMNGTEDLAPGEVRTNKTATPVDGMVNTWDIEVRIEGRDDQKIETTDVVLVIDRSGSMADNNRMGKTKDAANNFINTMIPQDDNLRIAIVSYSSQYQGAQLVTVDRHFTKNTGQLTSAVNGLNALGGTHTQAGIVQGEALLDGSSADNKYMVLLSDGQPTFSYRPNNWSESGGEYHAIYDGSYNTNEVVGDGSNLTDRFWEGFLFWRYYNIHNGDAAVRAGVGAREGIEGLFTIAVETGDVGDQILQDIASPGMAYSTENPDELTEIYDQIGSQIATQYALRNVKVVDEMGDGFSLVNSTLDTTEGSAAVAPAGDGSNETITWTIDPAVTKLVPGTTDVRYAEMTYRIEINDEILDVSGAKSNDTMLFKSNKVTQLTYKDVNDESASESITSPTVDPVLLRIKKILINPAEPETRRFNVEISKEEPNAFNQTVELVPNAEDYVWLTSLRYEGTYKVEETSITGDGIINIGGFDISYKIDDENKESFQVYHDIGTPPSDIAIEVTNKLFAEATPDDPLIRVSKTFSGLTQEQIGQLSDFMITITSESDSTRTRNLSLNQGTIYHEENGDITYKWEIEGWPAGTYKIAESGEELENYGVITENDGTVTTIKAEVAWDTELWKKTNTQVYNDLKKNGISPNIVATKLTNSEGVFVWTQTRLSASQRLAVIDALSSYNELGLTTDNGFWYSGEDIAGEDFYFRGYKIQYNYETGTLHIPQSSQWALIISGAYDFEGGDPADIAVKNTYTLNTLDVTIEKEVTGNFGDLTREFDFTVIANEDENNSYEFKLSHGDDPYVIEALPANAIITLQENNANGYEVTVVVGEDEINPNNDGIYIIDLSDYSSAITITVTNHKNIDIDTGISLDSLPYILILTIAMGGLGVTIIRKRNTHNQD